MIASLSLAQYNVTRVVVPCSTSNGLWSALAATTSGRPVVTPSAFFPAAA